MLLWERMHSLHGFENCMMDIMDDRPEIHELADRLVDYDIGFIRSMHASPAIASTPSTSPRTGAPSTT